MHQETLELNCSRTSLALDSTLVVVVEMSLSAWLVCAEVPGLDRRAMKKMSVDEAELLSQLHRWRDEAEKRFDMPGLSHLRCLRSRSRRILVSALFAR